MLLEFLAPKTDCRTFTVPVSTDITERVEKDGVLDRDVIVSQTKAALDTLRVANPYKVITLGGECSVSRLINDIAAEKELVALTVAEPMPRLAIRLKNMLAQLPLIK